MVSPRDPVRSHWPAAGVVVPEFLQRNAILEHHPYTPVLHRNSRRHWQQSCQEEKRLPASITRSTAICFGIGYSQFGAAGGNGYLLTGDISAFAARFLIISPSTKVDALCVATFMRLEAYDIGPIALALDAVPWAPQIISGSKRREAYAKPINLIIVIS